MLFIFIILSLFSVCVISRFSQCHVLTMLNTRNLKSISKKANDVGLQRKSSLIVVWKHSQSLVWMLLNIQTDKKRIKSEFLVVGPEFVGYYEGSMLFCVVFLISGYLQRPVTMEFTHTKLRSKLVCNSWFRIGECMCALSAGLNPTQTERSHAFLLTPSGSNYEFITGLWLFMQRSTKVKAT